MDQTGLNGTFDFTIEWTRVTPGDPPPAGAKIQTDNSGPELREAINEQLGLKLESRTGPVSVIVLDHVEHPSGNRSPEMVGDESPARGTLYALANQLNSGRNLR